MASSGEEEDEGRQQDLKRIRQKIANLPTKERLLAEQNPNELSAEQLELSKQLVRDLFRRDPKNNAEMQAALKAQQKQFKSHGKKSFLLSAYQALLAAGELPRHQFLERFLITKAPRSQSGVLVITVFTSAYPDGQPFSCQWNCYYCPNEPQQPRSYLLNEPGVRRANRLDFDAIRQFDDRLSALVAIGHPGDKVELLVLGGTWESYPESYRIRFIRDVFFAANTYDERLCRRAPFALLREQIINETARCKIIGITLETRPDTVNELMLVNLRQLGCTRVQLGVQHTDDNVLTLVNRQAYRSDTVRAIRLLKDSGFKVDVHLMPDLPGSSPELDKLMFNDVLYDPDLQADQWKIYPCQTVPFSVIQQWYEEGRYKPYGLEPLIDVIMFAKRRVHPWVRINRILRDIPSEYVLGGVEASNLRQLLHQRMELEGSHCRCIRCREVKGDFRNAQKLPCATVVQREYEASGCHEVFLSVESPDERTIFGFLRLRLPSISQRTPFAELQGAALIRELHVYGNLVPTIGTGAETSEVQHRGLGTMLLQKAEAVAGERGFSTIAVISGVGVRNYYRQRGYTVVDVSGGAYLVKQITDLTALRELEVNHGFFCIESVEAREERELQRQRYAKLWSCMLFLLFLAALLRGTFWP